MVWAGDGVLRDEVQRTAGPRVHVLGRRNDVPELQCAADLLVAPSCWYEAFSLVLAEAAACGRPAIAARIGGIPEVVQDGQTGMLFEPGDRAALAANLIDLLRDGALRTSLGAAARCRADALFSLDHMVSATIDEYRNLLKGPASTPTATSLVRSAHA
jgi:glycosyltransferase involved in cell wall biosynthesis